MTVIIDLTPIRNKTGPARLLDMLEGRSKQAFKTWLSERPQAWRDQVEVVAMDGFTGFKTATAEELPGAVAVARLRSGAALAGLRRGLGEDSAEVDGVPERVAGRAKAGRGGCQR